MMLINWFFVSSFAIEATKSSQSAVSTISKCLATMFSFHLTLRIDGIATNVAQRHAVLVEDSGIEIALDLVDFLLHELQAELSVAVEIVKKIPARSDVVLCSSMRRRGGVVDAQFIPFVDIFVRDCCEIGAVFGVSGTVRNLCHGFNTNNALQGEIGVISDGVSV